MSKSWISRFGAMGSRMAANSFKGGGHAKGSRPCGDRKVRRQEGRCGRSACSRWVAAGERSSVLAGPAHSGRCYLRNVSRDDGLAWIGRVRGIWDGGGRVGATRGVGVVVGG